MRLTIHGLSGTELDSLEQVLRSDDLLRSAEVIPRIAAAPDGAMSSTVDALLVSASSGTAVAVVQSISNWLVGRKAGVRVKLTNGERTIEIDAASSRDPQQIVALLKELDSPE